MFRNSFRLRFVVLGFLIVLIVYLCNNLQSGSEPHAFRSQDTVYIWCTFSRVKDFDTRLQAKFLRFVTSLRNFTDVPVSLNVIADKKSEEIAKVILGNVLVNSSFLEYDNKIEVHYYDISPIVVRLEDMINTMKLFFTPGNNTYYGNALFYISMGLHQVIPLHQRRIILLDVDVELRAPISKLYEHFYRFSKDAMFGLARELSPVYLHILQKYRRKNPKSKLGLSTLDDGNQGYNSGVVLMDVEKLRHSNVYKNVTKKSYVEYLSSKYSFVGHLGDQDFYTVLSFEQPQLIYTLPCQWNRALCTWWKHHGYRDVFDKYFHCPGDIYLYHGNCNTPIDQK